MHHDYREQTFKYLTKIIIKVLCMMNMERLFTCLTVHVGLSIIVINPAA